MYHNHTIVFPPVKTIVQANYYQFFLSNSIKELKCFAYAIRHKKNSFTKFMKYPLFEFSTKGKFHKRILTRRKNEHYYSLCPDTYLSFKSLSNNYIDGIDRLKFKIHAEKD